MIIDLILDRKDGLPYNPREMYWNVMGYNKVFDHIGDEITLAMDYGTEKQVKQALCNYVINNGYNPEICKWINKVDWIGSEMQ